MAKIDRDPPSVGLAFSGLDKLFPIPIGLIVLLSCNWVGLASDLISNTGQLEYKSMDIVDTLKELFLVAKSKSPVNLPIG